MATPISPSTQDSLQTLDARVELNLLEVLAKSYGEGFVKAVEGMEAKPQIKKDDSRLLKEDVARLTKPIQDYNKALAGKVDEIVRDSFAAGKDDMEVARILRARIPEILNNEPITIQRPGKRPVSFTADEYADIVANVVPYAVRNEGYIRGLKEAGADGWQSVAVGDERMCPMCGEKHGQVYGWDDPKPPYHVSCRCRPVAYFRKKTKEEMAESERIKAWAEEKPWETPGTPAESSDEVAEALIDDITRDMPKPKPTHIVESGDPITNIKAKLDPMDSKEYYGFRSKLREASDQVVLNHLNEPELRILDEHLSRLQKRCDDLGIPRLRGVADGATNVKAMASMSDGYLAVTPQVFQIDADIEIAKMIPRNEARILELEQYIKQNQSFLEDAKIRWTKNNQRLIDEGVTFEESSFYVGHPSAKAREIEIWAQEISECKSRVSDLKNRGKDALLNHWVPGNDLKTRPFAADEFFDLSQKPKILLDHEFGHHIHQQLGATKSNWKSSTTTEKKIATIYKKAKKLKDFVAPTKYSDSGDDQEWFAESYACYVNGRKDLVDKRLLSLFQELKL